MFDKPTNKPKQPTLDELLAAKAKLEEAIQQRGQEEIQAELAKTKALASTLGLTVAQLFGITPTTVEPERKKRQVKVKYRSPNGEEWSGRGRPPLWLQAQYEQGKTKEDFLIQ